jgi:hypothetical protein
MARVSLPFDSRRERAYEFQFGAGGNRLGCKMLFDDGSLLFVHDSQLTAEIEQFVSSLGLPAEGSGSTADKAARLMRRA